MALLRKLLSDIGGQGLVEYGSILLFVSIACYAAVQTLGIDIAAMLANTSAKL